LCATYNAHTFSCAAQALSCKPCHDLNATNANTHEALT
jgi:hypothetical protein